MASWEISFFLYANNTFLISLVQPGAMPRATRKEIEQVFNDQEGLIMNGIKMKTLPPRNPRVDMEELHLAGQLSWCPAILSHC